MKWIVLIIAIVVNALANILIKAGMIGSKEESIISMLRTKFTSLPIISGIICFAVALGAYSYVLSKMELSIAYPIMTTGGLIIIGVVSVLYYKETITVVQVLGLILLVAGIWLVAK